jgi:hypothetical protein
MAGLPVLDLMALLPFLDLLFGRLLQNPILGLN